QYHIEPAGNTPSIGALHHWIFRFRLGEIGQDPCTWWESTSNLCRGSKKQCVFSLPRKRRSHKLHRAPVYLLLCHGDGINHVLFSRSVPAHQREKTVQRHQHRQSSDSENEDRSSWQRRDTAHRTHEN